MLTSHIVPHKGVISLMCLPAQKFDLLIVSDSGMGLMPAQSENAATFIWSLQPSNMGSPNPSGEVGPRARSLV